MVKLFAASAALLLATATAASVPDGKWPTSAGSVRLAAAQVVKAGEVFDGKMQTYERSDVSCEGQTESGADTAVFKLEPGATLKNVIIGKNQMEGVHCDKHDCTIENVWWDDVCEDALSVKGGSASSVTTVTGGGARSADDKVIQHNGLGTVKIDGFYGEDVGKLYRSCGTCGGKARKVSMSNVLVVNPTNAVVTVNKNWGDQATLSNIWVKSSGSKKVKICQWSQGNANGEPSMLGDGPSPSLCQYSESDVHINGNVAKAGGTSGSPVQQSSLRGSKAGGDNPQQDDGNNDNKGQSGESKKSKSGGDKKKKDDGNNEKQDDGNNEKQESKGNSSSSNKKNDGKGNKKQGDNDDDKKQSNNSKGDKKNEGKSDKQNEGKGDKKKNDDDDN